MPLPRPVIFVPGVTATHLRDLYPLPPETLWSLLTHDFERVHLHPEDQRYEARLPAQVRSDQVFEIAYKEMVLDLRHDLTPRMDMPAPVYVFGYDWRQPLEITQRQLGELVNEVINKTCLTRHYRADGYANAPKVDLIGHSMGGLVIAGFLADAVQQGADPRVERVATIATPYRGSLEAVTKLVTGTANRREREAARLTPSLYYLMPSFTEGITIDAGLPQTDLFDERLWQRSLVETLVEAIRAYGSGAVPATQKEGERLLATLLGQAKRHRQAVETLDPAKCGIKPGDWACFIGFGDKTRVALDVRDTPAGPMFDVTSDEMFGGDRSFPPSWRTGDGTVPLAGALPPFPAEIRYFSHHDFKVLELREKALDAATALHGILPNMDKLQSALLTHLTRT